MNKQRITPMFEQYLQIKDDNPDALVFFRMGDFYELFYEDAKTAAKELGISLTARNKHAENPIPMCGVPHHSYKRYASVLLGKGYRIAICDQVEDPREAKGLVKRAVTRTLTPGTVLEDEDLTAKNSNYLAALFYENAQKAGGLAWADVSTGEWSGLFVGREEQLWQWLEKLGPQEILLPHEYEIPKLFTHFESRATRVAQRSHFDLGAAKNIVLKAQGVADLAALDLADKNQLVQACGAILTYLKQTQQAEDIPLKPFSPINLSKYLLLDEITERNLEIFKRLDGGKGRGTLLGVLDKTLTPMGGRLLAERLRQPWQDMTPITKNLDAVQFFYDNAQTRQSLRNFFSSIYDVERLITRIHYNRATPKDFAALRTTLESLPEVCEIISRADDRPPIIKELLKGWDNLTDHATELTEALKEDLPVVVTEGGLFKQNYNSDLDELISLTDQSEQRLNALLEKERTTTGLEKLKLGFNKVFGYYLELSKAQAEKAPYHYQRKQTLVNAERYVTPELKALEEAMITAADKRKMLEYKLFTRLREKLAEDRHRFMDMASRLAALDYWQGLAHGAHKHNWCRPSLHTGLDMEIRSGRHPVVEYVQGPGNYIPNDLNITDKSRVLIITGPNMAGKSTVIRQAAIITIMAQIGGFVPASSAKIGLADRIFSRVGASDNLAQGQSTFMVEMMETARILRQAGKNSLVILDEIGRGTSTFDGLSLAWAVAEDLATRGEGGIRTLFATHYHELTTLSKKFSQVVNFNIAVKEYKGDIVFLRRIIPGPSDRSYGIEVAKLAGVPQGVISRAKEILTDLEKKAGGRCPVLPEQPTLPGLKPAPEKTEVPLEVLALAKELKDLQVESLTPLEALNFLHSFKALYAKP